MKRVLLIDYMGSVYTHYHRKEKHLDYLFIENLRNIVATYKVDKTFVLCEGGGSKYRTTLHPGYKASRKARKEKQTPAEKKAFEAFLDSANQLVDTKLGLLGCCSLKSWGVEADDIAAFICHYLPANEYEILLLTEDSDWSQLLVRQNTVIGSYKEMTKEPLNGKRWKRYAAFTEEKGLTPEAYFVRKMLIGDTSDDIPGLCGVGETLAQKIVETYPTLAEIVANKDTIKLPRMSSKAYESLANCEETFTLGYQLMNLHWPEEKWAIIFGEQALSEVKQTVDRHLTEINTVNKDELVAICYELGWLSLAEDIDEFVRPFSGNKLSIYK